MSGGRMLSPAELTKELRARGYLSRQNDDDDSLFLNLGGPKSQLNAGVSFQGAILLNPRRNQVFGACPEAMFRFRYLVLEQQSGDVWAKREGIPGPLSEPGRVAVRFIVSDTGENCVACVTEERSIPIDGVLDDLPCGEDGYEWDAIEQFLHHLRATCD